MTGPGIFSYSTTAANNINANTGITWDEGMNPGLVNNSARQNMADTRAAFNDLIWFKYGKGDQDYSPVYVASNQFKIAGIDVSLIYHAGRRVRAVGSLTGTIFGTISAVVFSTDTTVSVVWDSGSLSNETLTISLSQIPVTGSPVAAGAITGNGLNGTFTPTDFSGASLTLTTNRAVYSQLGNRLWVELTVVYPSTADVSHATIALGSLPNAANVSGVGGMWTIQYGGSTFAMGTINPGANTFFMYNADGSNVTNSNLSGKTVRMQFTYATV